MFVANATVMDDADAVAWVALLEAGDPYEEDGDMLVFGPWSYSAFSYADGDEVQ